MRTHSAKIYDGQSVLCDETLYKSANLDDNPYHPSRSKIDSGTLLYQPRSSKVRSFNRFAELFDLPYTETDYDSPTSLANQSIVSLHFNKSETTNGNI